jgi:hypothetical protein
VSQLRKFSKGQSVDVTWSVAESASEVSASVRIAAESREESSVAGD